MTSFHQFWHRLGTIGKLLQLSMIAALAAGAAFAATTWKVQGDLGTSFAGAFAEAVSSREATIAALVHARADDVKVMAQKEADYQRSQAAVVEVMARNADLDRQLVAIEKENHDPSESGCAVIKKTARELWPPRL